MTKRRGVIFGTFALGTLATGVFLVGHIAVRKFGSGTVISMGASRQPSPRRLGETPEVRLMNGSEMPVCAGE